jgi:hypothetical protein
VDKSGAFSDSCVGKDKSKAPVLPDPPCLLSGRLLCQDFANGSVEAVNARNDEFKASQSSCPAGLSTSQYQRRTTAARGYIPVSVLSVLQALDLTSVPFLY